MKYFQALRQFRRMCSTPTKDSTPKNTPKKEKFNEVATYTSPFGEEENEENLIRPQTRAKARKHHQRTPFVHSAPQLPHIKRPRSRRKPAENEANIQVFLSLPNTPDTEDPLKLYPSLASNESYI